MMAGRRRLSDDEHTLWRQVTRSVAPLKRMPARAAAEETELSPPAKTQAPPKTKRAVHAAPVRTPAAPKPPPLAPIERRHKKKLARGTESIDARLDLHGCTQSEAHAALLQFLRRAQHNGARYVLVITGKGRAGSDGFREMGVLKRQVPQWLAMPEFRGYVVGFEDAAASHGGEGALYVRLRRGQ
jgi:DNA-nicking Smr family endonuclease